VAGGERKFSRRDAEEEELATDEHGWTRMPVFSSMGSLRIGGRRGSWGSWFMLLEENSGRFDRQFE